MTKQELLFKVKGLLDIAINGEPLSQDTFEVSTDYVLLPSPISYSVEREGTIALLETILKMVKELRN